MGFGRKPGGGPSRLKLWDEEGRLLFDGRISALEFEEACVVRLSEEFYGDPNPCEIHRSAVMRRAMMEIERALPPGQSARAKALPPRVLGFFGRYPLLSRLQMVGGEGE
jgi:hypothetical protein